MKIKSLLLLILIAAVIATGCVYAVKPASKPKASCASMCSDLCSNECSAGMGFGFGPKALAVVNPSKAQTQKLQSIHNQFVNTTKGSRSKIQVKMKELAALWSSGKGNEAKVKSIISDIERERTNLRNAAIASTFKAMNVLNNTQKAKLRASVSNGYVHLVSIGTRMNPTGTVVASKAKNAKACATSCK